VTITSSVCVGNVFNSLMTHWVGQLMLRRAILTELLNFVKLLNYWTLWTKQLWGWLSSEKFDSFCKRL